MTEKNNLFIIIQNRQTKIPIGRKERDLIRLAAETAYRFGLAGADGRGGEAGATRENRSGEAGATRENRSDDRRMHPGEGSHKTPGAHPGAGSHKIPGAHPRKLAAARKYRRGPADAEIAFILTDDAGILKINRAGRGIDKATDVLSFPASGTGDGAGEIYISAERAHVQAAEYGHGFERELGFLCAHGALHLMGYDHGDGADSAMFGLTEKILEAAGLPRGPIVARESGVSKKAGFRSGFIVVTGKPNVGKSTLINALCGNKLSIVTDKPQTTRRNARMILTTDSYQYVFVDTPGLPAPKNRLGEHMRRKALGAVKDADAALFIIDPREKDLFSAGGKEALDITRASNIPVILLINKVDLVAKESLLPLIARTGGQYGFEHIIPISANAPETRGIVLGALDGLVPAGEPLYPEDMITDQTSRRLAEDIIREKALKELEQEIPHGIDVEVDRFFTRERDGLHEINATVYCEREAHKKIIIGKGGGVLKRIGTAARPDIERMQNGKVYLTLWVKVRKDWRDNAAALKRMGYAD